jgi:hypothetical protein
MALNFGILQPVNIGGQFMAGRQQAQEQTQRNELAQQQASIREQEMGMRQQEMGMRQQEATERAEDRATKLANAEKRNKFLTNLSIQMEKGGHKLNRQTLSSMMNFGLQSNEDSLVKLAGEGLKALDEQDQFASIMGGGAPAAVRPPVTPGALGSGTFDPNAPTPVAPMNALAPTAEPVAPVNALAPTAGPDQAAVGEMRRKRDQLLAMGTTRSIAAANALDRDIALASKTSDTPEIVTMRALGYPPTQAGYQAYRDAQRQERMLTPLEEAQRIRIAQASRPPGAGVAKAPSGYRVTPTGELEPIPGGPAAGKPMTDLQKQAYRKDFANDTSKIKSATDTADELEKLTDELVGNPDKKIPPHPGLGGITGYTGMLPSLPTGEAAKAEQKLETFKGKIKALGRAIASQEGKLGNMAVQEWQMVSDAVQAIKPTAGNLDEQMRDVVRQARVLSKNMQDKFDLTYEETPSVAGKPAAAPAAAPAAGGKLSSTEQAELDALRKRFGK